MKGGEIGCLRCGTKNSEDADFCMRCGLNLRRGPPGYEALVFLHLIGAGYLLLLIVLNTLVISLLIEGVLVGPIGWTVFFLLPMLLGFYAALLFNRGKFSRSVWIFSLLSSVTGAMGTGWLFVIGIEGLGGVIGPAWLIFVASSVKLLSEMGKGGLNKPWKNPSPESDVR